MRRRHPDRISSVAILTPSWVPVESKEWDISKCYWGGGERYAIDLAKLLVSLGIKPTIYQPSTASWSGEAYGIEICGLGYGHGWVDAHSLSSRFRLEVAQDYDATCWFNVDLASCAGPNDIAITHGIWWDRYESIQLDSDWVEFLRLCHTSPKIVVSVDTPSIDWVRATLGHELARKMRYIPNYALESDYPHEAVESRPVGHGRGRSGGRYRILFARRFVKPRGFHLMVEVADQILSSRDDCCFEFLGTVVNEPMDALEGLKNRYKGRVDVRSAPMEEMSRHYLESDISVIPTISSEGTSLTVIESMAAGCAVVTTHVGGLSNLVIDNYNGILCRPSVDSVRDAILGLLDCPWEMERLSKAARSVFVSSFTMSIWRMRWIEVLREVGWIR